MSLTPAQQAAVDAVEQYGSIAAAARATGKNERTFRRSFKRAQALLGRTEVDIPSPGGMTKHKIQDGQKLKGYSALFSSERGEVLRWVKANEDLDRQIEIIEQQVSAWAEELKGSVEPVEKPVRRAEELLTLYPMGDPHFGLYCWAKEVGYDFDLGLAEQDLLSAMDYLVDRSPPSKRAVLANLGDFFHYDSMENLTPASKHVVDSDTRPQRMIEIGVRALRRCIHRLLEKHEQVEIINCPGNHDPILSRAMSVFFANMYEREPRLSVHSNPTTRFYVRHGKVLLGFVHGHQTKDSMLPGIMATERAPDWGETKHRVFFRGHHHQDKVTDENGCKVEQVRTLAPGDAYAVGAGYLSPSDMKCIVYHADHGEIERHTFGLDRAR